MILLRHLKNSWLKIKLLLDLQNIQSLAIEKHKAVGNLPGGNLGEFFIRNNHNYNLRSKSALIDQNLCWNSILFGTQFQLN